MSLDEAVAEALAVEAPSATDDRVTPSTASLVTARSASPAGLSPREVEVLRLIAAGQTNKEIAEALALSFRTVERHITHLYEKIGARGRADAVVFALKHGLT
jgi:DNA-binding NarL/FixJ family response regulator